MAPGCGGSPASSAAGGQRLRPVPLHWEVRMQPFAAPILAAEVTVTHTYLPNEL
jgi:hypothetical protein